MRSGHHRTQTPTAENVLRQRRRLPSWGERCRQTIEKSQRWTRVHPDSVQHRESPSAFAFCFLGRGAPHRLVLVAGRLAQLEDPSREGLLPLDRLSFFFLLFFHLLFYFLFLLCSFSLFLFLSLLCFLLSFLFLFLSFPFFFLLFHPVSLLEHEGELSPLFLSPFSQIPLLNVLFPFKRLLPLLLLPANELGGKEEGLQSLPPAQMRVSLLPR